MHNTENERNKGDRFKLKLKFNLCCIFHRTKNSTEYVTYEALFDARKNISNIHANDGQQREKKNY